MVKKKGQEPMLNERSQKLANSAILTAVSRLSMVLALPTLGLISTLGASWLDQKFAQQELKLETYRAEITRVETVAKQALENASRANDRLISVETKQASDAQVNMAFQRDVTGRLDKVNDSLTNLSNIVAALTATLQAQQDRRASSSGQITR